MDFGDTLLKWWPLLSFAGLVAYWGSTAINRLQSHNDKQDTQIAELTKKVEQLFILWNDGYIRRRLDKLDRIEEHDE